MSTREPPPSVWLASFVAVVDHGTFTAAAQALVRSQPRVSAHVAALERYLGVEVFHRRSSGVQLTSAGTTLLPYARSALRELRNGLDAVGAMADTLQGRVRFGSYPGAMAVLAAPLVQRFRSAYPGVAIELDEADPAPLEDAVADRRIDLALRTVDVPQRHHDVPSEPMFSEKIMLVVRHDHRFARRSRDLAELSRETVIVSGDREAGWSDYRERLDRLGIEPRAVITVIQPTTVVALVREGLGVGLLGALAARITVDGDELRSIALPSPLWLREIRLYRQADAGNRPELDAFVDLLRRDGPALTGGCAIWPTDR